MATTAADTTPDLADVIGDDNECIAQMRSMFLSADMLPHFPMSTERVSELLKENGYRASVEVLEDMARRGMVPDVPLRQGRFCWMPTNALTAAIHCDTWRMFWPLHPRHLHRLTGLELEEQKAAMMGGTVFSDADTFTIRAFVQMLENCADSRMRHVLSVALRSRLDKLGVLDS